MILLIIIFFLFSDLDVFNLSIDELIAFSLQNNKTYLSISQNPKITKGEVITAGLLPNPTAAYSYTFIGSKPLTDAGAPESTPSLSMEVDFFKKRSKREEHAKNRLLSEELSLKEFTRDFSLHIKYTYRELIFISDQIKYKKEFLLTYLDLLKSSMIRLKNGDISGVEYDRLDLERIVYESEFLNLELRLENISQKMRLLLGIPYQEGPLILKGKFVFEELQNLPRLENTRYDIAILKKKLEEAQSYLILKQAERWPSFHIGSEYRKKGDKGFLGIYLSIPLPIFNHQQGEIVSAKEKITKLEYELEGKQNQVNIDILEKKNELLKREKMMKNYEELKLLEKNTLLAQRSRFAYLKQSYSVLALIESQRNYINVNWNYHEQLFLYYVAYDNYISSIEGI